MRIHPGVFLLGLALASSSISHGKELSDFDGTWRQDISGTSSISKAKVPKELVIKVEGDKLMLTMKGPGKTHNVNMTLQIGGPEVTYTGLDGDEFHVKVIRDGNSLVFNGLEHEEGRILRVHEVWTLRNQGGDQVLVDTKNAKSPGKPARIAVYERVKQAASMRQQGK